MPVRREVSAGGVVYRKVAGKLEILLCGRGEPVTWGLPKGTLDPWETLEEAARREVAEETGLKARSGPKIGTVSYSFARDHVRYDKTVHYYLMEPVEGSIDQHDTEYDVVRWFPLEEAIATLTFSNDSEIVRRAAPMVPDRDEVVLEGRLVRLRPKTMSDARDEFAWRTDRELTRLDAAPPFNPSFAEYLILYSEQLRQPPPGQHSLAVDTLESEHIGNCMYYNLNAEKGEAEIGIMIGQRSYWDKDYGSDAVSTLIRYLFTELKLKRVILCTLVWNLRAQRCFEKCGFTVCGRIVREGQDLLVMEIDCNRWLQKTSAGVKSHKNP